LVFRVLLQRLQVAVEPQCEVILEVLVKALLEGPNAERLVLLQHVLPVPQFGGAKKARNQSRSPLPLAWNGGEYLVQRLGRLGMLARGKEKVGQVVIAEAEVPLVSDISRFALQGVMRVVDGLLPQQAGSVQLLLGCEVAGQVACDPARFAP